MNRKLAVKIAAVAAEHGATVEVAQGRKHDKITVGINGRTRLVVCSHSPSDCFAEKRILGDVRREIRSIAA